MTILDYCERERRATHRFESLGTVPVSCEKRLAEIAVLEAAQKASLRLMMLGGGWVEEYSDLVGALAALEKELPK